MLSSVNLLAYSFNSGSCRSSRPTPCRKEASLGTHLSPTLSGLPKSLVQQVSVAVTEFKAHVLWTAPSSCDGRTCTAAESVVREEDTLGDNTITPRALALGLRPGIHLRRV